MPASREPLSKSRILAGLQCPKRLYLHVRTPSVVPDAADGARDARRALAAEAIRLARARHPDGLIIAAEAHDAAVRATRAAMNDPATDTIFEAAFTHGGVRVRVDLLLRAPDGAWDVQAVKPAKQVKGAHLRDLALQVWALRGAGVEVRSAGILHLDGAYVRGDAGLDAHGLFVFSERRAMPTEPLAPVRSARRTDALADRIAAMDEEVARLSDVVQGERPPDVPTGPHCQSPHPCPFRTHCGVAEAPVPRTSVRNVPNGDKLVARARELGVDDVRDLPPALVRGSRHAAVVTALVTGVPYVSPRLRDAIADVTYPIGFLDFETFAPAIPRYAGTRPMQVLPTQWSLHVLHADGRLEHRDYLHDADTDPRPALCAHLLEATVSCATIMSYSHYEEAQVRQLMRDLPAHADALESLRARLRDLLKLVEQHYYHPDFGRSYSLKRVAPVLSPSVRYDGLAIADGLEAVEAYAGALVAEPALPTDERARLRAALRDYCALDTRAMVEIWRALCAAAPTGGAPANA